MTYIQNINKEETGLKENQKYTMFRVDEFMALTHRTELVIEAIRPVEQYAQYSNVVQVVFKQKGKRKPQATLLKESMLFLRGWDLGLKIDTDFNSFAGNALLNFVGNPEHLKQKIDELNDFKQANKGIIAYSEENAPTTHEKKILYPELADLDHAVVRRMTA